MDLPRPKNSNRTKTKHYHVTVGPLEVNLYNLRGLTFVGPYYDIIFEDAEEAVRTWAGIANEISQVNIDKEVHIHDEDVEELIDEISSAEWSFTYDDGYPNIGYEFGDYEQYVTLTDCSNCLPKSNN